MTLSKKVENNEISSLKFSKISNLKSDFFVWFCKRNNDCFKKNEIYLHWISFEQFSAKSGKLFFRKKSRFFEKFHEFFSKNLKKISNFPKFRKFIYPKIQVCEVSEILIFSKKWPLVVGFWKKIRFSNSKSDFFLILQKKQRMFRN